MLDILHIGNTAAVGSTLARWMGGSVICRNRADPWGLTYYGGRTVNDLIFVLYPLVLGGRFDVLHVHYDDFLLLPLDLRFRDISLVMHYHGSDIRGRWDEKEKFWSRADAVLVSTRDLLEGAPSRAVYLPNPVETEFFFDREAHIPGSGLCFSYGGDGLARRFARDLGVELDICERTVPFLDMPDLLSRYEYYFDVRRPDLRSFLSKTGLEALACGCKVVRGDGEVFVDGLPPVHEPRYVARKLSKIYSELP